MTGFEKIDLNNSSENNKDIKPTTMVKKKRRLSSKSLGILIVGLIVIVIFSVFTIVLPAEKTYQSALKTYQQSKLVSAAIKLQNVELASEELDKTQISLKETQTSLKQMSYLRFIPLANWYYNDATHLLNAGGYGLDTGKIVLNSLKPYIDVLGLKGKGSFVMGSAEERIKTAVMTMGKITPQIDNISAKLQLMKNEIDAVDAGHYPSFIFGKKIQSQLSQVKELTDQGSIFVDEARPLIKVIPSLLGEKEQKRYFIIFQNDKELRPTGGFMTAYAVFNVDKGVLKVERSDDMYRLDDAIANKPKAPEPILKYLPKVSTFNLRDSNLSPDFIKSMQDFKSLYSRSGGKVDVDGIIAIDTNVLVSTIKILDDSVSAGGLTFTTKNDSRCDCPQVIYTLEDNISRPVGYVKEDRKGLLGQLLFAIMQKALTSSPKIYWGPLMQSVITQANQKHVLFYLYDTNAQSGIESLNLAGRVKSFDGDYLYFNEANMGGQKANLFTKEAVENSYRVKGDGTIEKTVTIDLKNNHAPSDCNLERGGLCLNAVLRDWFRLYVPKGSKLISVKGSEVKVTTYEDLGKTVFDGFLTVRPLGQSKLVVTYELPFKLKSGSSLPLLIQKQPGTDSNMYINVLSGHRDKEFPLQTDMEMQLKF